MQLVRWNLQAWCSAWLRSALQHIKEVHDQSLRPSFHQHGVCFLTQKLKSCAVGFCRRERTCISDDISLCFCFAWSRLDGALLHACSARRAPSVPAEASGNSGPSPQNKEHLSEGDLNLPQCLHLLTNWISLAVISVVKLLLLSFHRSWVTCRRV